MIYPVQYNFVYIHIGQFVKNIIQGRFRGTCSGFEGRLVVVISGGITPGRPKYSGTVALG